MHTHMLAARGSETSASGDIWPLSAQHTMSLKEFTAAVVPVCRFCPTAPHHAVLAAHGSETSASGEIWPPLYHTMTLSNGVTAVVGPVCTGAFTCIHTCLQRTALKPPLQVTSGLYQLITSVNWSGLAQHTTSLSKEVTAAVMLDCIKSHTMLCLQRMALRHPPGHFWTLSAYHLSLLSARSPASVVAVAEVVVCKKKHSQCCGCCTGEHTCKRLSLPCQDAETMRKD